MATQPGAIERAFEILRVIQAGGGTMALSDISRELGLPKSTVHRILATLARIGAVRKNPQTDLFSLAHRTVSLGLSALEHWDFYSIVTPRLEELRDRLGETVAAAVRAGHYYTYVARAPSRGEYYFAPIMGRQNPLHWAAAGKAILAFVPDSDLNDYLTNMPLESATRSTVTDPGVLRAQLDRIRNDGYAVTFGERVERSGAVAAPIRDREGVAFAAIAMIAPGEHVRSADMSAIGKTLTESCRDIERACWVSGSSTAWLA